ncbi:hypothetical protein ACLB2K_040479 [Fragaria x ananassa]
MSRERVASQEDAAGRDEVESLVPHSVPVQVTGRQEVGTVVAQSSTLRCLNAENRFYPGAGRMVPSPQVPKSPREGREVTRVKYRVKVVSTCEQTGRVSGVNSSRYWRNNSRYLVRLTTLMAWRASCGRDSSR